MSVRKALSDAWYGNPPDLPFFSDVAVNGRCPTCGGWQFTAKRSMNDKLWYGAFALPLIIFARKTVVRCDTCGATFLKG
jgi:hypothetical protein